MFNPNDPSSDPINHEPRTLTAISKAIFTDATPVCGHIDCWVTALGYLSETLGALLLRTIEQEAAADA